MFFRAAALGIPIITLGSGAYLFTVAAMEKAGFRRVSIRKNDPGERLYAISAADRKKITVFFNDEEAEWALTADEQSGMLTRYVVTDEENIAINYATNEALEETVYGRVRIEIGEPGSFGK
jgi:hypothetical protein